MPLHRFGSRHARRPSAPSASERPMFRPPPTWYRHRSRSPSGPRAAGAGTRRRREKRHGACAEAQRGRCATNAPSIVQCVTLSPTVASGTPSASDVRLVVRSDVPNGSRRLDLEGRRQSDADARLDTGAATRRLSLSNSVKRPPPAPSRSHPPYRATSTRPADPAGDLDPARGYLGACRRRSQQEQQHHGRTPPFTSVPRGYRRRRCRRRPGRRRACRGTPA